MPNPDKPENEPNERNEVELEDLDPAKDPKGATKVRDNILPVEDTITGGGGQ